MQVRGERLGEPIGERLDEDRAVVVVLALEALRELVGADAGGDRERADVVAAPPLAARRDEVGERQVRLAVGDRFLLAQHVEPRELAGVLPIAIHDDVVAFAGRRPEAVDAARGQQLARATIRSSSTCALS